MYYRLNRNLIICISLLMFTACGDDEEEKTKSCKLDEAESCEQPLVCEQVEDAEPMCVSPVVIRGRVFDAASASAIANALIIALDVNGGARSNVAGSEEDGSYEVVVPMRRNAQGEPLSDEAVTLYVAASTYQSFPSLPRETLPIDLAPEPDDDNEQSEGR